MTRIRLDKLKLVKNIHGNVNVFKEIEGEDWKREKVGEITEEEILELVEE